MQQIEEEEVVIEYCMDLELHENVLPVGAKNQGSDNNNLKYNDEEGSLLNESYIIAI